MELTFPSWWTQACGRLRGWRRWTLGLAIGAAVQAAVPPATTTGPEYPRMGPDIFDRKVDAEALIADAIVRAAPEQRTILLLMGANWCPWCRRLHQVITEDPEVAALLNRWFVLVYVDVSTRNDRKRNASTAERFGNPVQEFGLPVFVVLDARGKKVSVRETSSLSAPTDEEVSRRLLAFLRNPLPPTP